MKVVVIHYHKAQRPSIVWREETPYGGAEVRFKLWRRAECWVESLKIGQNLEGKPTVHINDRLLIVGKKKQGSENSVACYEVNCRFLLEQTLLQTFQF